MLTFIQFQEQVEAAKLQAIDRGHGHWQVLGGALRVSFYPNARRGPIIYVCGTTRGRRGSIEDAIAAASTAPALASVKDGRIKPSIRTKWKKRKLKTRQFCIWCNKLLTWSIATVEHVIPLDRGGLDNHNNWALACYSCNNSRGNDMPEMERKA